MSQPLSLEQRYYGATARHYDPAYATAAPQGDIEFYVDTARRIGGPVLEVACGTGRVLIPTAEAGVEIDGLDFTSQFLDLLRAKVARLPAEVRSRIRLHQGDMRDFALERRYRLATIPFRPLQHLLTVDDQISALSSIHRHLEPGGFLAFNVFYPDFLKLTEPAEEREELSWQDPERPGVTVKRFFFRKSVNRLEQYFEADFIYRSFEDGRLIQEERSTLRLGFYTYPHLLLLFRLTGFDIAEQFGSFDRKPIDVCQEMIFLLRKK